MGQTPRNGKVTGDPSSEAMPQDEIGKRLRAMYAEVESEDIPADLIALLEQLDAAEERGGK
jgi:hypothetical protein